MYKRQAYGPRVHGIKNRAKLDEIVENSLRGAALWDEVKDLSLIHIFSAPLKAI